MQDFSFVAADDLAAAGHAATQANTKFIGGGTDLMQLMKENVETPTRLVDLEPLLASDIATTQQGVRIAAAARMADVAAHPTVTAKHPMVAAALLASASPQVRNMATIGGNLLQRTRCLYFRDATSACNKRAPGTGCPALQGDSRNLAILGTSQYCIASHPSDLAVALVAADATLELQGPNGTRSLPIADFHRLPADRPDLENNLQPGEIIQSILLPASSATATAAYLKVRDRTSFAFAVTSAAVALTLAGGNIRSARVAAGGVGTRPWRLPAVEAALLGKPATDATYTQAAAHAADGAQTTARNHFKTILLPRTIVRALQMATA